MSILEIVTLIVIGIGFLGLIAYIADHAVGRRLSPSTRRTCSSHPRSAP